MIKPYIILTDYLYDFRNGLNTTTWVRFKELTVQGNDIERSRPYQPTRVVPLRRLLRKVRPSLPANSVLLDIGCGKARVLLIASEFDFDTVRGVEFARELCEIAGDNCTKYKDSTKSRTNFEIIEGDAANYQIRADENVFFLFNPFDGVILSKVINNISNSLRDNPRKVLLICNNLQHPEVINDREDFDRQSDFSYHGHKFIVYSNRQ